MTTTHNTNISIAEASKTVVVTTLIWECQNCDGKRFETAMPEQHPLAERVRCPHCGADENDAAPDGMSAIELLHSYEERLPVDDVWCTSAGRILKISAMTSRHLGNAIALLWRRIECLKIGEIPPDFGTSWYDAFGLIGEAVYRERWLERLRKEAKRRGNKSVEDLGDWMKGAR